MPQLNALSGTIKGQRRDGRWAIEFDDGRLVSFKQDNLIVDVSGWWGEPSILGEANLDAIGEGLPVHEIIPLDIGPGGAMGVLVRRDHFAFSRVLEQLGRVGWVALDWGEGDTEGLDGSTPGAWERIMSEGELLWPMMEPGKIMTGDGREWAGISPSGAARGDRFVCVHDERLGRHEGAWSSLRSLHAKMQAFGFALGEQLQNVRLMDSSDTLFACFPGAGTKYNCHYDGGPGDQRRLTAILYVNEGWRPQDGGALMIYDKAPGGGAAEKCWRSVHPCAGRFVLFRSDCVLHKVAATWAKRYALTVFFIGKYSK